MFIVTSEFPSILKIRPLRLCEELNPIVWEYPSIVSPFTPEIVNAVSSPVPPALRVMSFVSTMCASVVMAADNSASVLTDVGKRSVGKLDGAEDGSNVGEEVGISEGTVEGTDVGNRVGSGVGPYVSVGSGDSDGWSVGVSVGAIMQSYDSNVPELPEPPLTSSV